MSMKQKIHLGHPTKEAQRRYGEQIYGKFYTMASAGVEDRNQSMALAYRDVNQQGVA